MYSIDGVYPLYLDPKCAYKHDGNGEYIARKFSIDVSEEQTGRVKSLWTFYQPKANYSPHTGQRFDGGFPGGNGDYHYASAGKPFEDWVIEHPEIPPQEPNVFIPFKPTSGPSSVVLETGIVIPVPTSGPSSSSIVSGVILPPDNGPHSVYTLTNFYTPVYAPIDTGPSNISLIETAPESGPTTAALFDRSNPPSTGPATTVLLEVIFPPVYGPRTVSVAELPPILGPSSITLIELAPNTGPSNPDPVKLGTTIDGVDYLIPTSGPVSLYGDKAQPLSGPDSIATHLLPANGPVDTSLAELVPYLGPTNVSMTATYGCFGGYFWTRTDIQGTSMAYAVIEGLTSGARSISFSADIGSRRLSVRLNDIYTSHTGGNYTEGELIKVSNASGGIDGYYRIASYSYTDWSKIHSLHLSCDDMMPMKGPSSIGSVKTGTTVDGVTYLIPTVGPQTDNAYMPKPETGPSSAEIVIAPPLSGPKTLVPEELTIDIESFFTNHTHAGFASGEVVPANMAFHPFLGSIYDGTSRLTTILPSIGPGNYNINKEGDYLTFDNPYNYSHTPSITVNSSTGKNMYAYNGYGTASIDCNPLMPSLTAGSRQLIRLGIYFSNQYFAIDSSPYSLVNCTHDHWYPFGINVLNNYRPKLFRSYLDLRITPTQAGPCSVTFNVKTGIPGNTDAYGTKLRLTLTWDVQS